MTERQRAIRWIELEPGETVLLKAHAAISFTTTGNLYLTSTRLIWIAHRLRFPGTKERQVVIPLEEVEEVHVQTLAWFFASLECQAGEEHYSFSIYRGFGPLFGWAGLHKQWASRIDQARRDLLNRPANGQLVASQQGTTNANVSREPLRSKARLPGVVIVVTWLLITPLWLFVFSMMDFSTTVFIVMGVIEGLSLLVGILFMVAPAEMWALASTSGPTQTEQ